MKSAAVSASVTAAPQLPVELWRAAGAAVMGVSHKRSGLPCQDAQGYRVLPDGVIVVALADGAGSAAFSESGACTAVEAALEAMIAGWVNTPTADGMCDPQHLEQILRETFAQAREAVLQLVEREEFEAQEDAGEPPLTAREFASTLTCAVASPDCLAVGQVGDGAVVALGNPDELIAVTRLQRGEYANETHFLVEEDALDQLTIDFLDRPVNGLAVMSDGLIRLALRMPSQDPHLPFFQPLFRFAQTIQDEAEASAKLAAFLDSDRVNDRTDDDKSLVLAVRVEPVTYQPPEESETSPEEHSSRNGEDE